MVEKYGERPNINTTKKTSELINEPKKEPINEPIKQTKVEKPAKVEKPKTKPIQIVEFREEDIVESVEPVKEKRRKLTKK
jgi:hypothetical protein